MQAAAQSDLTWNVAAVLPPAEQQQASIGVAGPIAGVHNDVLIVAGGCNFPEKMPWLGGIKKYYDQGYVMAKQGDSLVTIARFQLPFPLAYAAITSAPDGIVAAGGENASGLSNKVLLIQWQPSSRSVQVQPLPPLPYAVTNASAAFAAGKIYLAGGEKEGSVSPDLLSLDLRQTATGWMPLPSVPVAVSHAVLVVLSLDGKNYLHLVGGRKRNPGSTSTLYTNHLQYDVAAAAWSRKKELPYALSAGTGLAAGGRILLFGGDAGTTFHKTEALIAAIASEPDPVQKEKLNQEKISLQAAHPGFCRQLLSYDAKKDKWTAAGCLPFEVPVTTTAVSWNNEQYLPAGEIRAGVRTPNILRLLYQDRKK